MKLWMPLLIMSLSNVAGASSWQPYLQDRVHPALGVIFPDQEFIISWKEGNFAFSQKAPGPETVRRLQVGCADRRLWALHPYQDTKDYLGALAGRYDHLRLSVDSSACTITDSQRRNYRGRYCPRATEANIVLMADTYQDGCGQTYRGYWVTTYLSSDENMGTLVAKGRSVYQKPGSEWEFVSGYTFPVEAKEFLFLSPLWPEDATKVQGLRKKALSEGYVLKGLQFWAP